MIRVVMASFLLMFGFMANIAVASSSEPLTQAVPSDSVYNLNYDWLDQNGQSVRLTDLAGRPVLLAMAYTECKEMCPIVVHKMMDVEDNLSPEMKKVVRFVLVSFDSDKDTPSRLKAYAQEMALGDNWTLLHGSKDAVRSLATVFDIPYRSRKAGGFDHEGVVVLLDQKGALQFRSDGPKLSSSEVIARISKLVGVAR